MGNITDTAFHGGKEKHQEYYSRLMITAVDDGRITERDKKQIKPSLARLRRVVSYPAKEPINSHICLWLSVDISRNFQQ